jgi:SAM-dependent methyltransferase
VSPVERLPAPVLRLLRRMRRPTWPGVLRRTSPVSHSWGFDRGTPVDRYYIEQFLSEHRDDVRGRVLEIKDSAYTDRFGTGVEVSEVLDMDGANPRATVVADLAAADHVPSDSFDCFVLTQTLHLIYDVQAAVAHAHRILRPGGVLLVTAPVTSRILPRYGLEMDHWRFTPASCRRLFGDAFGPERVTVTAYGNVLACKAFLDGVAAEELPRRKLDVHDPYFPLVVTVRAVKQESP